MKRLSSRFVWLWNFWWRRILRFSSLMRQHRQTVMLEKLARTHLNGLERETGLNSHTSRRTGQIRIQADHSTLCELEGSSDASIHQESLRKVPVWSSPEKASLRHASNPKSQRCFEWRCREPKVLLLWHKCKMVLRAIYLGNQTGAQRHRSPARDVCVSTGTGRSSCVGVCCIDDPGGTTH